MSLAMRIVKMKPDTIGSVPMHTFRCCDFTHL
jgi:hypothetical protein